MKTVRMVWCEKAANGNSKLLLKRVKRGCHLRHFTVKIVGGHIKVSELFNINTVITSPYKGKVQRMNAVATEASACKFWRYCVWQGDNGEDYKDCK